MTRIFAKRQLGVGAIGLATLALVACPAMAPKFIAEIPDMVFEAEDTETRTVPLNRYFEIDPKGSYRADSDTIAVAIVGVYRTTLTVAPGVPGMANVTVTASNSGRDPVSQTFSVTVKEAANNPPTIRTSLPNLSLQVGETKSLRLADFYRDPEGDDLTYDADSNKRAIASVSDPSADSTITITAKAEGLAIITVSAKDTANAAVPQSFGVMVTPVPPPPPPPPPVNNPPTIRTSLPNLSLQVGETKSLRLADFYRDPEGDDLTYDADSNKRAIASVSDPSADSTITITAKAEGLAIITVSAKDTANAAVPQSFGVMVTPVPPPPPPPPPVNNPPTIRTSLPNLSLQVGETKSLRLADFYRDPEGDDLTYDADSNKRAIASVSDPSADSTITITAEGEGPAIITVSAKDTANAAVPQSFSVTVVRDPEPEPEPPVSPPAPAPRPPSSLDITRVWPDPARECEFVNVLVELDRPATERFSATLGVEDRGTWNWRYNRHVVHGITLWFNPGDQSASTTFKVDESHTGGGRHHGRDIAMWLQDCDLCSSSKSAPLYKVPVRPYRDNQWGSTPAHRYYCDDGP